MIRRVALLPLAFALTACTPEGYPSTDLEMIAVTVIILGGFALIGFFFWCVTR